MSDLIPRSPLFFFFFQAEDGIRDYKVTGVQTCALPISRTPPPTRHRRPAGSSLSAAGWAIAETCGRRCCGSARASGTAAACPPACRSEERRVGEEGRSWWAADHLKKKKKQKII